MKVLVYEWKLSKLTELEVERLPNMNKEDLILNGQAYTIEAIEIGETTKLELCAIGERCDCGGLRRECSVHRVRIRGQSSTRRAALRPEETMTGEPAVAIEDTAALYDEEGPKR
jgi:hypothetical protein